MARKQIFKDIFRLRGFRESFKIASFGIVYLFLYHRNMRVIFTMGILAALLGVYFKLKGIELIALCITITLVFMAEIFNTAVEMLMDIISDKHHVKIKLVKDISAAITLIASLNAAVIGYALFIHRIFK